MSAIKEKLYRHSNLIESLSQTLSDKLWGDGAYDQIKDKFLLCALADAINSSARELDDLVCCLSDPGDNDPQSPDNETGVTD